MSKYYITKTYIIEKIIFILYYLQLYYEYLYNILFKFFVKYSKNDDILFIKNNKVIQSNNYSDNIEIPQSDFCVIKYKINNTQLVLVTDNYDLIKVSPKYCKFNFILVIFICKNKEYDITKFLKNKNHTYYLQDAILFSNYFNKWLCMNYLKIELDNIKIRIIDQNTNQIEINSNQYIKLGSNTYHISE
tara:strand:+ start:370 stop:936 length:567 start_codon:yes stop_codon:yes gene_type:complete